MVVDITFPHKRDSFFFKKFGNRLLFPELVFSLERLVITDLEKKYVILQVILNNFCFWARAVLCGKGPG